jgi:hypothetical protein
MLDTGDGTPVALGLAWPASRIGIGDQFHAASDSAGAAHTHEWSQILHM